MDIFAPFAGTVRYEVAIGDFVRPGQTVAKVESVKLEGSVISPGYGVVTRLAHGDFEYVAGGEMLLHVAVPQSYLDAPTYIDPGMHTGHRYFQG